MHRGFLRGFLPTGFLIVASLVIGFLVSNFLAEKEGEALPKKNVGTVVTQSMNKEVIPDQKPEKLVKVAEQSPVEIEIHRPAISEKVDSVLKELSDQSAQYSGLELRQRQCDLLLEILQSGKLSCGEKMELCKNVHCSVSDATLSICWNMTFISASSDSDFEFRNFINDWPAGRLGADLLATAGLSMSTRNRKISENDLEVVKNSVEEADYKSFLGRYIQGFTKADPSFALELLAANKQNLDDESVAKIMTHMESPQAFAEMANSELLYQGIRDRDQGMVNSLVSGWVAVAPKSASEWVSNISDPAVKSAAAEALVSRWSRSDLAGAAKWLASTNLQGMDAAVSTLSVSLSRYTPAEARQWAEQIKDEQLKKDTLETIGK